MAANSDFRLHQLKTYYRTLRTAFGLQHWWPGRTPMEVIVGAYLTQNTSWNNVELALRRLRARRGLSLTAIRKMSLAELEDAIRPAGYFRQKAARLKTFVEFVDRHFGGSLKRMFAEPTQKLRQQLLDLNGVGPETADSILLYAGQHPVFVVDAYARRIVDRHRIFPVNAPYDQIRELFERALANESQGLPAKQRKITRLPLADTAHTPSPMSRAPRSVRSRVLNETHALVVAVGKHYCSKSNPNCHKCPLRRFLPTSGSDQAIH